MLVDHIQKRLQGAGRRAIVARLGGGFGRVPFGLDRPGLLGSGQLGSVDRNNLISTRLCLSCREKSVEQCRGVFAIPCKSDGFGGLLVVFASSTDSFAIDVDRWKTERVAQPPQARDQNLITGRTELVNQFGVGDHPFWLTSFRPPWRRSERGRGVERVHIQREVQQSGLSGASRSRRRKASRRGEMRSEREARSNQSPARISHNSIGDQFR